MTGIALTVLAGLLGLVSATISAITGVGGGVLLLSGLLLLVPATAVVPLHGAAQFVAGYKLLHIPVEAIHRRRVLRGESIGIAR